MKTEAKVVVIGGGVVGVSTLYHLAKKGWGEDSVLLEKHDLTSGSTWHAAGLLPLFNMSYSVGKIHKYSVDLYNRLDEETGMHAGLSVVSNVRLAKTKDRMDEYLYYEGVAKTIGIDVKWLTPEDIKAKWDYVNTDGLLGAIQHTEDGYIQPADLTQALAKGARNNGGKIYEHTSVTGIVQQADGKWLVQTDKGDILAEHVVSCTGSYARKTGEMVGINIPVMPVEHQFIVTEPHPDLLKRKQDGQPELCVLRESDSGWYMREEAGGLLLGPYEEGAPACYVDGPAEGTKYELFDGDLDRLMPHIETAIERVPYFGEAGVKEVYNGAIAYTPDGNPIIGPAGHGLKNFWLNEGHSFGITAAGGAGWQLAEWIIDGEPTIDMLGVDPRRFGDYATRGFLVKKCEEAYDHVFKTHYPDEQREAARPLRTHPSYPRLKALGGVFGDTFGWERAHWFKPSLDYTLPENEQSTGDVLWDKNYANPNKGDTDAVEAIVEKWSFRRSNYFDCVGAECRNVMNNVGVLDMSAFSKFTCTGPGAEAWLNSLTTNTIPKKKGRIALTYLLTEQGGVLAEFTVYKRGEQDYYLVSAGAQEAHDWDYLLKAVPKDGSVNLQKITTQMGVLVLAGPNSRKVLEKLTDADLSTPAFPWLSGKTINVGAATAEAIRVNFVGEYGWELHHPIEMQAYILDKVLAAGAEFDIKPFGIYAMNSMRLEKSYCLVGTEMSIEYAAYESGLGFFIKTDKEFVGKKGLLDWKEKGLKNKLVTLEIHGVKDADARGSEAVYKAGQVVGRITSGGYGFRVEKSLALAMLPPELTKVGTEVKVRILGEDYSATVIPASPYDKENEKLRQ
ncbi:GcvT family protein [Ostreibacterium oceani]|uniref:FAD-dependent oxidoreductase n=1 Tax=Ostreibacterium oceani TaxID=2654998 RepID=A0A6N7EV50_9GAMM|nr:FAD-dependent oxidoreductase [Ostreibacterium oceani]MPV85309.1 FAD-dependent oxidoreductase [Ostreibacterium oceani]